MTYTIYNFLVLGLLQIQCIRSQNRFCPEAVSSMQSVATCPTSKREWDSAALKKNCSKLAPHQNCVSVNKFKYHCVINGLRNKLLEVCAPERIIFGHCVEFNVRGGVIQDQKSALCNKAFPKCDRYYNSTDAYRYPDCYMLVSNIWLTTKDTSTNHTTMRIITDESSSSPTIIIIAATLAVCFIALLVLLLLKFKKRRMGSEMLDESKEAMLEEINIKHADNTDDVEEVEQEDKVQLLNFPDNTDDVEKVEQEDTVQLLNYPDNTDDVEKVEQEDKVQLINSSDNTDDVEKVEQEDKVQLINSLTLCGTSHLKRRCSTNEYPTFKTEVHVSIHHGRKRINSAGF